MRQETPKMIDMIDEREETVREATNRERGVWEELIYREASRVGVRTVGRSAGQVVTRMADLLAECRFYRIQWDDY
jgi:hypothetical protein